jgi:SAM-dependent methyltransferase
MVHSYSTVDNGAQLIPLIVRDDMLKDAFVKWRGGKFLNLGCGKEYYDSPKGWVNLDGDPKIKCDVLCDLDDKNLKLPFKDDTFGIVWASHVFEHIFYLGALKKEIHRILKPGGTLCFIVPYYLYQDAWGDDTHCRAFSEASMGCAFWQGFTRGIFGHLPTINYGLGADEPTSEFWLWCRKEKGDDNDE